MTRKDVEEPRKEVNTAVSDPKKLAKTLRGKKATGNPDLDEMSASEDDDAFDATASLTATGLPRWMAARTC